MEPAWGWIVEMVLLAGSLRKEEGLGGVVAHSSSRSTKCTLPDHLPPAPAMRPNKRTVPVVSRALFGWR